MFCLLITKQCFQVAQSDGTNQLWYSLLEIMYIRPVIFSLLVWGGGLPFSTSLVLLLFGKISFFLSSSHQKLVEPTELHQSQSLPFSEVALICASLAVSSSVPWFLKLAVFNERRKNCPFFSLQRNQELDLLSQCFWCHLEIEKGIGWCADA